MPPNPDSRPRLELQPLAYTMDQAAVVCGRTKKQLYKDIATGVLRSYKHGRRRMVTVDDLQRHVARLAKGGAR
jgi:excisionase family DNA binding protein